MKALPADENIVIPRAKVFFRPEKSDGTLEDGYIYLGDMSAFTTSGNTTRQQVYSHTGPVREKLLDATTQVDRSATGQLQNVDMDGYELFIMGTKSDHTQASGTATTEQFTAKQGQHFKVGLSTTNPYGVQDITVNSVVTDPGGTPVTQTEGTDYEVDTEDGSIYIIVGGGIADDDTIEVDYDNPSRTVPVVDSNDKSPRQGEVYLSADNSAGANRDVRIPKCQITPDGDLPWVSAQEHQQIPLAFSMMKRSGYEQVYVIERVSA